jgi:hypothetical protein
MEVSRRRLLTSKLNSRSRRLICFPDKVSPPTLSAWWFGPYAFENMQTDLLLPADNFRSWSFSDELNIPLSMPSTVSRFVTHNWLYKFSNPLLFESK